MRPSTLQIAAAFEAGGPIGKDFTPAFENLPASPDQISGDKPYVLLVEDHAGVISYVKSLLTPDYFVQVAMNGQESIELALEHIPDLTIPDVCRLLHLSHTQLYRKLKALTGKTPSQFINTIRLQRAKQLLENADLNISEVAYSVGFNNPNYFSRVFKKEFGVAPGGFGGRG
ncbi:MAG: helix-turn-helix domain-containing protein [Saprospiraceae bacterium]